LIRAYPLSSPHSSHSSYYDISYNVFYLNEGLKSDYHGHTKLYHDNINIGAAVCCFQFGFVVGKEVDDPRQQYYEAGHTDHYYRNRCVQAHGGSWVNGAYAILNGCNASLAKASLAKAEGALATLSPTAAAGRASAVREGNTVASPCAPAGKEVLNMADNIVYHETRKCDSLSGCDIACGESTDTSKSTMLSVPDFQRICNRDLGTTVLPVPTGAEMERWSRELLGV
jgi:hypothetical protein